MNETIGLVITASVVFCVIVVLGYGSYLTVRDAEIRFQERKKKRLMDKMVEEERRKSKKLRDVR